MLRTLGRPRIVALGVLLAVAAIVCVGLGRWQLSRLAERRDFNQTLSARTALPVVDLAGLVADGSLPEDAAYRRVRATGSYLSRDEVVVAGRSHNTLAGHHLVTPLLLDDAEVVVLVNRGWVRLEDSDPPIARAAPPAGTVVATGVLFPSQQRGRFGPKHATDGRLEVFHRVDVPRIDQQLDETALPLYLLLEHQSPSQPEPYPVAAPLPRLDEGPHLSYALQWFSFAALALATFVAYVVTTRRREQRASEPAPAG